jgi:hypothetical protein
MIMKKMMIAAILMMVVEGENDVNILNGEVTYPLPTHELCRWRQKK